MSLTSVIARVTELQSVLAPTPPASSPASTPSSAPSRASFAALLERAQDGAPAAATPSALATATGGVAAPADGTRAALLALVRGEVGQAEQPPGSNESSRIAEYRRATCGAPGPGPWCAYFVSWAARQAGTPLGDQGEGFGSVDALYAWAQRSGRAVPAGSGRPRPGDLIVWDEHIGVVESVRADGSVATIEGNSSDRVARRVHGPGDALGYVRMGG